MKKKEKIIMAMSGGVDSSVAAALLVEQGYDVTGAFMINFDQQVEGHGECWRPDYRDAVRVAAKLGIPLLRIDCTKEYREQVVGYMLREYQAGRTPNPDVMCNKYIKFGVWLDKLAERGFDRIATGHYACITRHVTHNTNHYILEQAVDINKDQTYFLHQLTQEQLAKTMFPLGKYTKAKVRELAEKFGLSTAAKPESMGICFIGDISIPQFLKDNGISVSPGDIVHGDTGEVVGQHEGLAFYTIGQRHGFAQQGGDKPLFVMEKRTKTNELVVGYEDNPALYTSRLEINAMHWIAGEPPALPTQLVARLRHRQALQPGHVAMQDGGISLTFDEPQFAVTAGQFAVLYTQEGVCLGGGAIK